MNRLLYRFLGMFLLAVTVCVGCLSTPARAITFEYTTSTNAMGQVIYEMNPKFTGTDNTIIRKQCAKISGCNVNSLSAEDKMALIKKNIEEVGKMSWDDYVQQQKEAFFNQNRSNAQLNLAEAGSALTNFLGFVADNPLSRGVARVIYGQETVDELQETRQLLSDEDSLFVSMMNFFMDDGCLYCGVVGDLFDSVNTLATNVFNNMAADFLSLMGIGIAFFILFKVGRMVVSLQEVDLMQFLNDLLGPLGRAIFASALLTVAVTAGDTVFSLITNPVIDVSLKLGQQVMEVSVTNSLIMDSGLQKYIPASQVQSNIHTTSGTSGSQDKVLDNSIRESLLAWMRSVATSYAVGLGLGATFILLGAGSILSITNNGFAMLLSGLTIFLMFGFSYLLFPLKLVDAFVRWAFVLTLMPLWIVLWVFPATRGYTKKAWEMFLGSALQFVTLAIMVGLSVQLMNHVVPEQLTAWKLDPISRSEFYNLLIRGLNDRALRYIGFGDGVIINAIAFGAMASTLLTAAAQIANTIAGGAATSTQTQVGIGMTAPIAGMGKVSASVGMAATKGAMWGVGKAKDAIKSRFGGSGNGSSGAAPLGTFGGSNNGSGGGNTGNTNNTNGNNGGGNGGGSGGGNTGNTNNTNNANNNGGGNGSNPQDFGAGLSDVTVDQQKAIDLMAKKKNAPEVLKNLSEDVAFVEQLRKQNLDRDAYKNAAADHAWKTNPKRMTEYANKTYMAGSIYTASQAKLLTEDTLREECGILSSGTTSVGRRLEKEVETTSKADPGNTAASSFLSSLSNDVRRAQSGH